MRAQRVAIGVAVAAQLGGEPAHGAVRPPVA